MSRASSTDIAGGNAMLAPEPAGPLPRTIALVACRPVVKGGLRGFATVELPIGLKLVDCPVCVGKNGPWASLPAKPQIDRDGRPKTDAAGKPTYAAILEWRDRALAARFSEVVVAAVRTAHPEALDGGGT
jgi:hypothetical protein